MTVVGFVMDVAEQKRKLVIGVYTQTSKNKQCLIGLVHEGIQTMDQQGSSDKVYVITIRLSIIGTFSAICFRTCIQTHQ